MRRLINRRKHVRSCCARIIRCHYTIPKLTIDILSEEGFLVAAFNCRGAGRSGGRGGHSAQTETADYESVIARLMSYGERASVPIMALYICVFPLSHLTDIRDIVISCRLMTDCSLRFIHCVSCAPTDFGNELHPHLTSSFPHRKLGFILHRVHIERYPQ